MSLQFYTKKPPEKRLLRSTRQGQENIKKKLYLKSRICKKMNSPETLKNRDNEH